MKPACDPYAPDLPCSSAVYKPRLDSQHSIIQFSSCPNLRIQVTWVYTTKWRAWLNWLAGNWAVQRGHCVCCRRRELYGISKYPGMWSLIVTAQYTAVSVTTLWCTCESSSTRACMKILTSVCCQSVAATPESGRKVIYGSTDLCSPAAFMEQLTRLK